MICLFVCLSVYQVEEHRVRRLTGTSEDLHEMLHPGGQLTMGTALSRCKSTVCSGGSAFVNTLSGFFEGLFLIVKYPYVLHVLGVTCLYEIVLTVMDYRFKLLGSLHTSEGGKMFHEDSEDMNDFANLLGHFG